MSGELANGQQQAKVRHSNHDRLVVRVAFSPDGRLLATASSESDRTAKEWALVGAGSMSAGRAIFQVT